MYSSTLMLNWAPGVVLWKPQRPMRTVLISSQFHCPRPPWLVCVPDQNRHYAGYYAPFSVSFDLNFWKLRFTHPKKMPVKKYPYAPTLVYFADKHLWHSRQRSRGAGVFSPSPNQNLARACKSPWRFGAEKQFYRCIWHRRLQGAYFLPSDNSRAT